MPPGVDTGCKFAAGVVDTGGNLPSVSFAAGIVDTGGNLLPVSTTPAVQVAKFAAGAVDTSGAPSLSNITLMLYSGAWEKMIHEKNLNQKIS